MAGVAWTACANEVVPSAERCNQLDDDCDGGIEPQPCVDCTPNTGTCTGNQGHACRADGLGFIDEFCDPLQGMTCDAQTGRCQGACTQQQLTLGNVGCDFFPTVTANIVASIFSFGVSVLNVSSQSAAVTVTQGTTTVTALTLGPGALQIIPLNWVSALKGDTNPFPASVVAAGGAYRVRSTQPIVASQFNPVAFTSMGMFSYSNEASLLLPVQAWGTRYRVVSRQHFNTYSGFYAVTARGNGTVVTVSGSTGTVKSGVPGVSASGSGSFTLDAGDVAEIVTEGSMSDLTGTLVTADQPIQVIGGHQCTNVPVNLSFCDHLEETVFPEPTLSTSYAVTAPSIPTSTTPKVQIVRILATRSNTQLSYAPAQPGAPSNIANAGSWVELAGSSSSFVVTADAPIIVAQYMEGEAAGGGVGDPSLTFAVPIDQYRDSYDFVAPTNYSSNYVDVVAPTGIAVLLDGSPVSGGTPIGASGFSVLRAPLSNAGSGAHRITASVPFGIQVYGYGQYTSWSTPGGANLNRISP